jgi:hypothetical protein
MWKEAVLSQHLPERPKKNHKKNCQNSQCPGCKSNLVPPKYKSAALLLEPTCLVKFGFAVIVVTVLP